MTQKWKKNDEKWVKNDEKNDMKSDTKKCKIEQNDTNWHTIHSIHTIHTLYTIHTQKTIFTLSIPSFLPLPRGHRTFVNVPSYINCLGPNILVWLSNFNPSSSPLKSTFFCQLRNTILSLDCLATSLVRLHSSSASCCARVRLAWSGWSGVVYFNMALISRGYLDRRE